MTMDAIVTRLIALLVVASLVAILARRLHLPYTVGLVATGLGLSLLGMDGGHALTHDLIFIVILPPLLFEATLGIPWHEFRRDALPVIVLATLGVVIAAVVVAVGMVHVLAWPLNAALVFGMLIAATDPVAVIAMFKDNRVSGRVRVLVESESLLNDGVAAVLFGLVLAWTEGKSLSTGGALTDLVVTAGGGALVGLVCGALAVVLAGRIADHLVETGLSAVAAYGSFLAAEHWHMSGVMATLAAGLIVKRPSLIAIPRLTPPQENHFVSEFWEFAAFIANSGIFLLIGLAVPAEAFARIGLGPLVVAIILVLIGRAAVVYGLCLPFRQTRWMVPMGQQHILWWGGLRGALGLALALALPNQMAFRDEIVTTTFAVVVFSVVVQGITMPALLRWVGVLHRGGSKSG
jgi:CPA1 family monovalent cation:H+ antiporter